MATTKEPTARQRARKARAAQLAARAAKDKLLEDLYTEVFNGMAGVAAANAGVEAAKAVVEAAELELAKTLAKLNTEGEAQQAISQAFGLSVEEVRRLIRAGQDAASATETAAQPSAAAG